MWKDYRDQPGWDETEAKWNSLRRKVPVSYLGPALVFIGVLFGVLAIMLALSLLFG
jgi:hypothetical protein